jgi:hypothetical protein
MDRRCYALRLSVAGMLVAQGPNPTAISARPWLTADLTCVKRFNLSLRRRENACARAECKKVQRKGNKCVIAH